MKQLPRLDVLVAGLKAITLTIGIGKHVYIFCRLNNLSRLLDVYWVPILSKLLKLNSVSMSPTMRRYSFNSVLFHITILIRNVFVLNNLFTIHTNNVFTAFMLIVQEYRECDVWCICMNLGKWDIVKTCEGLK